ncbi:hypothetical protein J4468_02840 [Candidatus Woesearchaeota archaeon]|nr:hypothetical protein [Candidatus Woesearchaeota archaeon]
MNAIIKTCYEERGFGSPNYVWFTDRDVSHYEQSLAKIVEADCNVSLNLELALKFEDGEIDTCELRVQDALMLLKNIQSRYYSDVIGKDAVIYRDDCERMKFIFVK